MSSGSSVIDAEPIVAMEFARAEGGALPGAGLVAADEVGESLRGERVAGNADVGDRPFDRRGVALDLDQHVHARVSLETDGRALRLEDLDLALDLPRDREAERGENLLEDVDVADGGSHFFAHLEAIGVRRRPFEL